MNLSVGTKKVHDKNYTTYFDSVPSGSPSTSVASGAADGGLAFTLKFCEDTCIYIHRDVAQSK